MFDAKGLWDMENSSSKNQQLFARFSVAILTFLFLKLVSTVYLNDNNESF